MQGVLTGFATIAVVIAVGALLAHLRVVDAGAQQVLSRLAFFVASPALTVLARDTILVTTVGAVPVILLVAAWLG